MGGKAGYSQNFGFYSEGVGKFEQQLIRADLSYSPLAAVFKREQEWSRNSCCRKSHAGLNWHNKSRHGKRYQTVQILLSIYFEYRTGRV